MPLKTLTRNFTAVKKTLSAGSGVSPPSVAELGTGTCTFEMKDLAHSASAGVTVSVGTVSSAALAAADQNAIDAKPGPESFEEQYVGPVVKPRAAKRCHSALIVPSSERNEQSAFVSNRILTKNACSDLNHGRENFD